MSTFQLPRPKQENAQDLQLIVAFDHGLKLAIYPNFTKTPIDT